MDSTNEETRVTVSFPNGGYHHGDIFYPNPVTDVGSAKQVFFNTMESKTKEAIVVGSLRSTYIRASC